MKIGKIKIIVCHLGNGASVCAVKKGQSVDTSMGFTPVEGLIMGTRTGDLDLGALLYIAESEKLDYKGMNKLINKQSGLCGISGGKSDMRDIYAGKNEGDVRSTHAFNMFAYRVKIHRCLCCRYERSGYHCYDRRNRRKCLVYA